MCKREITKEVILEELSKMNVLEIVELTKLIEKKFQINVQSSSNTEVAVQQDKNPAQIENKTVTVYLENFGTNKIAVIKEIRTITGLGLKEAKETVESAPVKIKENLPKEQAESIKDILEKVGATIVLK